jgi:single-strand DNA-binding protein
MAGEIQATIVGNLTGDPELRFTPSGKAVASFTVVSNNRIKDGNDWKDGDPTFVRCSVWEGFGENIAESLTKGMNVIVYGGMFTRNWKDKDDNPRTSLEMRVEAVGPNLRRATAVVTKVAPAQNGGGFQAQQQPADDPWATSGSGFANQAPPF